MALKDFFNRKKKPDEKERDKEDSANKQAPRASSAETKKEAGKGLKKEKKGKKAAGAKKIPGSSFGVLKAPFITEKAIDLTEKNKYTFKVFPGANKTTIKKAVEDFYAVDVVDVKIIKVSPKKRRIGKVSGWRDGFKKAVVKIKQGQKIEGLYP